MVSRERAAAHGFVVAALLVPTGSTSGFGEVRVAEHRERRHFTEVARVLCAGQASALALLPNGGPLLVGSTDGTVRVIRRATWQVVRTLPGGGDGVSCLDVSRQGRLVAAGYIDGHVTIWESRTWRIIDSRKLHDWSVMGIGFGRRDALLATAGRDGLVATWRVPGLRRVHSYAGFPQWANSVSFSPNGALLAGCGTNGKVYVWNVSSGHAITSLRHPCAVGSVAFAPSGRRLATTGDDGMVRVWQAGTWQMAGPTLRLGDSAQVVRYLDAATIACCSLDGTVRIWCTAQRSACVVLQHVSAVVSLAAESATRLVVAGGRNGVVIIWQPR